MYEQNEYAGEEAKADSLPGSLQMLDEGLERLAKAIDAIAARVGPLSNQYAGAKLMSDQPRPEPATQLHGRAERLADLVNQLGLITNDIQL